MARNERSVWGWGNRNEFSKTEHREELAGLLETFFGFPSLEPRDQPTAEDLQVPESRLEIPDHLANLCTTEEVVRARHTYGMAFRDLVRGFHGNFESAPDAVARPTDETQIESVLDWAAKENVAVTPFGGGTSVVGGVEADGDGFSGVLSLDLGELNEVLEVDEHSQVARIQAGAAGPEIESALAEYGLELRHVPQSYELSTLGGWIATRSGGHLSTLYTHIDEFLNSVQMVTPEGTYETRSLPYSGAGPDPNQLVLGSEGTLGVITEATMRLQPIPEQRSVAVLGFDEFEDGVAATRELTQARLYPALCRLHDAKESLMKGHASSAASRGDLPDSAIAQNVLGGTCLLYLVFESTDGADGTGNADGADTADGADGPDRYSGSTAVDVHRAIDISREHDGELLEDVVTYSPPGGSEQSRSQQTPSEIEAELRDSFFGIPHLYNDLVSLGVIVDTFETSVNWDSFDELHSNVVTNVEAVMDEECGNGVISCRFTHVYPDGPAPYYTFLAPGTEGAEVEQWKRIKDVATSTVVEYGGALTHHHAVGRIHKDWYTEAVPEGFGETLLAAKQLFDPAGIMNPGVILDEQSFDDGQ